MARSAGVDFGSYHLIRQLGQGGFAEVWEAQSHTTGRRVALKILTQLPTTSSNALERFRQEGRLAAGLHHPRCVYVFDAGAVDGVPYISMELMPGGTLADRVRAGPVPVAAAVDCVLDMLDGLEAAHATGIIHRDIKPSNVFLDERGRARIGDFGISKSLESTAALSVTGGFLGTPQYASPEQAGGELLDYRSDIYSAGAVLYELLTGRAPFAGENPAQALARVLTQQPEPFPASSPVPRGLQRVVRRLLAKQKEKRFSSYRALRDALLPYSSRGALGPADLARRCGAIVLDLAFQVPINLALLPGLMMGDPLLRPLSRLVTAFLYFTITERVFGASPGKLILGLRVASPAGPAPGLGRVATRSAAFVALNRGPSILLEIWKHLGHLTGAAAAIPAGILMELIGCGLVACTMRRSNGYAGVHELASRTRVIVARRGEARATVPDEPPAPAAPVGTDERAFGPFRSTGVVWRADGEALAMAHDDELDREVWIHVFSDPARVPAVADLQARGEGSLRWLQRGGSGSGGWDAYGAPGGIQLARWVARPDRPGWQAVRQVLESLGRELEQRGTRSGSAAPLVPEQVWVAGSGTGVMLDFPVAPGAPAAGGDDARDWRVELRRVARLGLDGADPVPLHARALLERLGSGGGVGPAFSGPGEYAAALEAVAARPAAFARSRRLTSLLMTGVVPALMLLFALVLPKMMTSFPVWFRDLSMDLPGYVAALRASDTAAVAVKQRTHESVEIVLAGAVAAARRNPSLGSQVLAGIPSSERPLVDSATARYPSPRAADVDTARAWLALHAPVTNRPFNPWMAFHVMGFLGIAAVVLALVLRGPLLLYLFGIAVVRKDGAPAGRVRCGVRSLVAWSPLIVFPVGMHSAPIAVQALFVGIAGVGAALSVARPARGPVDRIMRTVLVPK